MPTVGLQRRKLELLLEGLEQVPTLPGLAHHALSLATGDRPARRDLQMAVEVDPATAANTLKLAIDLGHPADRLLSVDAVFDALRLETLSANLLSSQAADPDVLDQVQLPVLWRHALAVAMAAQVTATRLGTVSPETALLAGLLHDVGQMALRILMPRAYRQVLENLETGGGDLLEAERRLLGIDHVIFGKRLAQRWGFAEMFQNVIWLHHQARVPDGARPGVGTLTQVVRLADLLARQHGFGYYASEQITENPAEAAERLGLSGAQADHIGRQIGRALDLNTRPAGFDDTPSALQMQQVYGQATVLLGRLYRQGLNRAREVRAKSDHAHRLITLNADLAALDRPRDVMQRIAAAITETLDCRVVVPYLVAREGGYIEGIRHTASGGVEDHFLHDLASCEDLEPPPEPPPAEGLARAERTEQWLFDRHGPDLGPGPFYVAAMTVGGTRIGGIVFSYGPSETEPGPAESEQIADLAGVAAIALKRAQAEADLVALSEELADANRRLETAHRSSLQAENVAALSAMATGAAHEINNPLAIISGRVQQLAAAEDDPERQKTLETVIRQAHRISDIISELQLFANPPEPRPGPVDPFALAQQVSQTVQPEDEAVGVAVQVVGPREAPTLSVDPDQVAAALGEVARNAVQACEQAGGGTVTLRLETLPGETSVRFLVTDDGPGMDPQVRARAFDPFYSGREAGRRRGLGLAKAYRAVQANGGQMAMESTPGQGTTVRVTFPAAGSTSDEPPASPSEATSGGAPNGQAT